MKKDVALFLYGFDIDQFNKYINFKNTSGGPELTAELNVGNYTATGMMSEIKRALELADGVNKYTVSINRGVSSGTSNNVTISTDGIHLEILFLGGSNAANSPRDLLGFGSVNLSGLTSYTSANHAGKILIPDFPTYDYLGPDQYIVNDGVKNISANGVKETLVFAQMYFIQGQWKYITDFQGNNQATKWSEFMKYATRQLKFEITPSIYEDYDAFYQVTLESTPDDSNGLGFKLKQMLGVGLYRFYDTGTLKFRLLPK